MQQFKTYPGIPPNGVVERPSILRIPPPFLLRERPSAPHLYQPPAIYLSPLPCARVLLHLTWEFRSYKLGLWNVCVFVLTGIETHPPSPDRKFSGFYSKDKSLLLPLSLSLSRSIILIIVVIKTRRIDLTKEKRAISRINPRGPQ